MTHAHSDARTPGHTHAMTDAPRTGRRVRISGRRSSARLPTPPASASSPPAPSSSNSLKIARGSRCQSPSHAKHVCTFTVSRTPRQFSSQSPESRYNAPTTHAHTRVHKHTITHTRHFSFVCSQINGTCMSCTSTHKKKKKKTRRLAMWQ